MTIFTIGFSLIVIVYGELIIKLTFGAVVGEEISKEFIMKTLKALEFGVEEKGELLKVEVPTFRATKDVSIKEDLVEEVARLYGYDNIQPKPLAFDTAPQELIKSIEYEYETKLFLAQKYGANEIHSYLWNYEDFNKFTFVISWISGWCCCWRR